MQRVAVLTTNRNTRRQIARALGSGGLETVFFDSPEALGEALPSVAPDLLIVDADTVAPMSAEPVLRQDRLLNPSRPVVLLSVGENKAELLRLIRTQDIGNLVAKQGAIRAAFPVLDERELLVTCQKVLRRDIFGIEKYVGLWGAQLVRMQLTSIADKTPFLVEFEQYLSRLDTPARVAPGIAMVAEELILNAMVHAPHDEYGEPKYESLGPRPDLQMEPHEYVQVAYCCDGQRLMLSVTDNFGRLSRATVLNYLARGIDGEKLSVETKTGGAGLGLSMAFGGLHQLIYNIQENVRTEAIAGWFLRVNDAREFRSVAKSLNLFWLSSDNETTLILHDEVPTPRRPSEGLRQALATLRASGNVLQLAGRIDENTDLSPVAKATVLELHNVDSFSSQGVLRWQSMAQGLQGRQVELTGCPEPLVRLAGEVNGLLDNLRVTSVMCPFSCPRCQTEVLIELPPAEVFSQVPPECDTCKGPMSFEGVEHQYRAFLEAANEAEAMMRSKP